MEEIDLAEERLGEAEKRFRRRWVSKNRKKIKGKKKNSEQRKRSEVRRFDITWNLNRSNKRANNHLHIEIQEEVADYEYVPASVEASASKNKLPMKAALYRQGIVYVARPGQMPKHERIAC
jgi:hypothetical protein